MKGGPRQTDFPALQRQQLHVGRYKNNFRPFFMFKKLFEECNNNNNAAFRHYRLPSCASRSVISVYNNRVIVNLIKVN